MALQPAVEDVLDEGRVIYQDLWEGNTCEAAGEETTLLPIGGHGGHTGEQN